MYNTGGLMKTYGTKFALTQLINDTALTASGYEFEEIKC